jgi:hypothetical protein
MEQDPSASALRSDHVSPRAIQDDILPGVTTAVILNVLAGLSILGGVFWFFVGIGGEDVNIVQVGLAAISIALTAAVFRGLAVCILLLHRLVRKHEPQQKAT